MQDRPKSLRDIRHIDKTFYVDGHDRFYESTYDSYLPSEELRDIVRSLLGEVSQSWHLSRKDVWTHIVRKHEEGSTRIVPNQGWKIHVSATNLNCHEILLRVAQVVISENTSFKFANDVNTLRLLSSKRWPRGGSGKFITIYPHSLDAFKNLIEILYRNTLGLVGSYILSDRRYKDSGCLYYRYGGIRSNTRLDVFGRNVEVLVAPDGDVIEDHRRPYFDLPYWEADPFPDETSDASEDLTLNNGRYIIKEALAFSNTGGVYLATDRIDQIEVVIKEARPGVELSPDGQDATDRLKKEADLLKRLNHTRLVPDVLFTFWDWENFYLVEERVTGVDMRLLMLKNTPLGLVYPNRQHSISFFHLYREVFINLLHGVDQLHSSGIVIGDLSPANILVDEDTAEVRLIDLEGAFCPEFDSLESIYTPGFRSQVKGRAKTSNREDDLYAAGAMMMYAMLPIVALSYIRDDLFSKILPRMISDLGWSNTPVLRVIHGLTSATLSCGEAIQALSGEWDITSPLHGEESVQPLDLRDTVSELARFTVENHRQEPPLSLFPLDPYGRQTSPLSLGLGASGIFYSLTKCGVSPPPGALHRYLRELDELSASTLSPGLLVGNAGIGCALLFSGEIERGTKFIKAANNSNLLSKNPSLFYGLAGVGLANLAAYLRVHDQYFLKMAITFANSLTNSVQEDDEGLYWLDDGLPRIGFGYGQSGISLFLLRLSQISGDPKWRDMGEKALRYELHCAEEVEPGVVSFGDSPDSKLTLSHYLEQGTAGIAKVAIRYGLWKEVQPLLADTYRKYSAFSGLYYGLSGFIDVLTDAYIYSKDRRFLDMCRRPLAGILDLYLMRYDEGLATPGDNLFRITCDYATGTAGVMRALHRHRSLLSDDFCLDRLDGHREI